MITIGSCISTDQLESYLAWYQMIYDVYVIAQVPTPIRLYKFEVRILSDTRVSSDTASQSRAMSTAPPTALPDVTSR